MSAWLRRHRAWGLPAFGTLFGLSYVFAGTLPWPMFLCPPLALAGGVATLVFGVRESRADRPLRRLATGITLAALYGAGFVLPIVAKRLWTERGVRQLPVLADAFNRFDSHSIVAGDGYPDYMRYYETRLSLAEAAAALRDRFQAAGWRESGECDTSRNVGQWYFTRGRVTVVC